MKGRRLIASAGISAANNQSMLTASPLGAPLVRKADNACADDVVGGLRRLE